MPHTTHKPNKLLLFFLLLVRLFFGENLIFCCGFFLSLIVTKEKIVWVLHKEEHNKSVCNEKQNLKKLNRVSDKIHSNIYFNLYNVKITYTRTTISWEKYQRLWRRYTLFDCFFFICIRFGIKTFLPFLLFVRFDVV